MSGIITFIRRLISYIVVPILGAISLIFGLTAYVVAYPLSRFIDWDDTPTTGGDGGEYSRTIRGDLPYAFRWYQSIDERFPGGLNEPTVQRWLAEGGKESCSAKWIMRNRAMGFAKMLGKETDQVHVSVDGIWRNGDIWRLQLPLGPLKFVTGYEVYSNVIVDDHRTFWAVPIFTFKKNW